MLHQRLHLINILGLQCSVKNVHQTFHRSVRLPSCVHPVLGAICLLHHAAMRVKHALFCYKPLWCYNLGSLHPLSVVNQIILSMIYSQIGAFMSSTSQQEALFSQMQQSGCLAYDLF